MYQYEPSKLLDCEANRPLARLPNITKQTRAKIEA